ncbi:MAG: hypothetical protein GY804_11505 [Alphaproteobacteria bacterium]|nr:hypothetical protein [Alphaproteobacteria bacterium]
MKQISKIIRSDQCQYIRTISVIKQLSEGKTIEIEGLKIGMGIDMSIGVVGKDKNNTSWLFGYSTINLTELNSLLNNNTWVVK